MRASRRRAHDAFPPRATTTHGLTSPNSCEAIQFADIPGRRYFPEMNWRIRVGPATDLSLTSAEGDEVIARWRWSTRDEVRQKYVLPIPPRSELSPGIFRWKFGHDVALVQERANSRPALPTRGRRSLLGFAPGFGYERDACGARAREASNGAGQRARHV